ncbi:MAG: alpha/beta hydrolase [Alphaproteobacteria bacterium]|nr:alpha/beta hydrolase [Alphaproteobacteria bacterium]
MNGKSIKFSFSNKHGHKLSGILDLPKGVPLFYGVFAPCFTCTKEAHAAHKVCRALAERGIGMLRFDMTGLGGSEGNFAETNFSTRILDIIAACHSLAAEYQPPKILIGHSISGTAALEAVSHLPQIQVLATLGSPCDPAYVVDKFRRNKQITIKGDIAELTVAGHKVIVKKSFIDDMLGHDTAAATAAYDRKLLVFQAPHDSIVSFENAQAIYDRATCDKELLVLNESATHLLEQGAEDADYIAEVICDWFAAHGR